MQSHTIRKPGYPKINQFTIWNCVVAALEPLCNSCTDPELSFLNPNPTYRCFLYPARMPGGRKVMNLCFFKQGCVASAYVSPYVGRVAFHHLLIHSKVIHRAKFIYPSFFIVYIDTANVPKGIVHVF